MRIISGLNRGKKITAPANLPVRPTTDLGKESLFNILNNYFFFDKVTVLDLFAGTGNITLEFASRQAIHVTSVDSHQGCANFISKMAGQLNYQNVTVIKGDAFQFTERCKQKFDIIFADPPYALPELPTIPELILSSDMLAEGGLLVFEHGKNNDFSQHPRFINHREYGSVNFSIFRQSE